MIKDIVVEDTDISTIISVRTERTTVRLLVGGYEKEQSTLPSAAILLMQQMTETERVS
jgi:hypothetical protein